MSATRGKGIHTLDDARWTPVYQHRQSQYVEGLCERCGGPIAPNEVHETRGWRHGPAEACQHIECPVERRAPCRDHGASCPNVATLAAGGLQTT